MVQNSLITDEDQSQYLAAKPGNSSYFSKLYDQYAPALLGIIKRIVNNDLLADEILQSTFIQAWNKAAVFHDSEKSVFTCLINLARHTAFEKINQDGLQNIADSEISSTGNNIKVTDDKTGIIQNTPSAFDLLFYMGLNCSEAAAKLRITEDELKKELRMKLKKTAIN